MAQELDLSSIRQEVHALKSKRDVHIGFKVEEETAWMIRRVAAQKRFHSVADMMRDVTASYLAREENQVS